MTKWAGSCIWARADANTTNPPQPIAPAQAGAASGARTTHPNPHRHPGPVRAGVHPSLHPMVGAIKYRFPGAPGTPAEFPGGIE